MILKQLGNIIYYWFPVLPFLGYWMVAYLAFHFGPFETAEIGFATHVYFFLCLILFSIAYKFGLGATRIQMAHSYRDDAVGLKVLRWASWLTFIGALLLIIDRLASGAGSVDLVRNDMANIRQEYADNTTILTTIAVLPQSFYLVTLASYFYCLMRKLAIPTIAHILIFSTLLLEIGNMVLSANRGALFWIATYVMFYMLFCVRVNLFTELVSKENFFKKAAFVIFCIGSVMYFLFVAKAREVDTTAIYLGQEASYFLKEQLVSETEDFEDLGARYQLFYYLTHGFAYMDAILKNAPAVNFDFLSPLGIRIESQIARFSPGYMFPAKENMLDWITSAGLSRFGWPTVFGASLAYFGVVGSVLLFIVLGFYSGYAVRRAVRSGRLGWLIIVFTIYASLNMSFDWILRNFDQYVGFAFGTYLIFSQRGLRSSQGRDSAYA